MKSMSIIEDRPMEMDTFTAHEIFQRKITFCNMKLERSLTRQHKSVRSKAVFECSIVFLRTTVVRCIQRYPFTFSRILIKLRLVFDMLVSNTFRSYCLVGIHFEKHEQRKCAHPFNPNIF